MPTFEEFVQIELPKRPFTAEDGAAGQVLVRSGNAGRPRELVWADMPQTPVVPTYTAGTALSGHRAVVLDESYNLQYASNLNLADAHRVFGITKSAAAQGAPVEVIHDGEVQEPSWSWTVGGAIYLGSDGTLVQSEPAQPALFLLQVGFATAIDRMFLSIGVPIIFA